MQIFKYPAQLGFSRGSATGRGLEHEVYQVRKTCRETRFFRSGVRGVRAELECQFTRFTRRDHQQFIFTNKRSIGPEGGRAGLGTEGTGTGKGTPGEGGQLTGTVKEIVAPADLADPARPEIR